MSDVSDKKAFLDFEYIRESAVGNYVSHIFPSVGITLQGNGKKHQPCPLCGGTDRFRCDDKQGRGTWICGQCGSGDGVELVKRYLGCDVRDAFTTIADILHIDTHHKPKFSRAELENIKAQSKARIERQRLADEQALQQKYQVCATSSQNRYSTLTQADPRHPYITKKQLSNVAHLLKQEYDKLIVPMYYTDPATNQTHLANLQTIDQSGNKLFGSGRTKDCYCVFFEQGKTTTDTIIIAEGVATALSVYLVFDGAVMVVCAFVANNLLGVSQIIKHRLPNAQIIICADDDAKTAGGNPDKNIGIVKAKEAAQQINAKIYIPKGHQQC